MKALSIRQPSVELILRGEKTLELRSWPTKYRGPLLLHASTARFPERTRRAGLDPDALPYGALVGVVDLIEVIPLDAATYEALRTAHRGDDPYPGPPLYGWRLANPRRLPEPIPWKGKLGLFDVEEEALGKEAEGLAKLPAPPPDPGHPFVLYTFPENGEGYRVRLYQWLPQGRSARSGSLDAWLVVDLGGSPLRAVMEAVVEVVQRAGYRAGDLVRRFGEPFFLPEAMGVRLALLLLAAKPLVRMDRLDAVMRGVASMSPEETYYWFSKCVGGPHALRAQRALRVLLAGE